MKSNIGVIGPQDSVNIILEIGKEFEKEITLLPFVYNHLDEVVEIMKENFTKVDVWLFSGQAPYAVAKESIPSFNGYYPSLNGFSLTKVLLDISYKDKKDLEHISFDTIPSNEVIETYEELEIDVENLKLLPYSGYKPIEELVNFHYQLYKDKKVQSCITGIRSVYEKLKELNVPTYRLKPTKMEIRETILLATQKGEIIRFQNSQISIIILQIIEMDKVISKNKVSFEAHRLSLTLQEIVIDFTEKIQGSFIQQGIDRFMIYSTRGTLEQNNHEDIFNLLEKINMVTDLSANLGIGYGITVLEAEQNAYIALNNANEHDKNTIMLADETGMVKGPLNHENSISYNRRSIDPEVLEKLQRASVNVSTYNKVLAIQDKLRQNAISANELAKWLGMTPRNARRILSDLEKEGLAKVIGEETPGARGRPRRLFKVGLIK